MINRIIGIILAVTAIGTLTLFLMLVSLSILTVVVHYGSQLISYAFTGIEELTWFQSFIVALIIYFGIDRQRSLKC